MNDADFKLLKNLLRAAELENLLPPGTNADTLLVRRGKSINERTKNPVPGRDDVISRNFV